MNKQVWPGYRCVLKASSKSDRCKQSSGFGYQTDRGSLGTMPACGCMKAVDITSTARRWIGCGIAVLKIVLLRSLQH